MSPALQVDSLPIEPQGKPKNTGVGSVFLLQRIFLTQESNWGFLRCRRTLYQLIYQGSLYTYIYTHTHKYMGFPGSSVIKNLLAKQEAWV